MLNVRFGLYHTPPPPPLLPVDVSLQQCQCLCLCAPRVLSMAYRVECQIRIVPYPPSLWTSPYSRVCVCKCQCLCAPRVLSMALDPAEVRTQDVATTIQWVADNPLGRDLAFQFFVANFDTIKGLSVHAVLSPLCLPV